MLIAMMEGSFASSPMILSAGGQDEQPWEVKSSTTARGSAWAGRMMATIAQSPRAPDQRETRLQAIIPVITLASTRLPGPENCPEMQGGGQCHRPPPNQPPLTSQ